MFIANYAQKESQRLELGIRFFALVSCPVNNRHMYCSLVDHNRNGRDRDGDGTTEGGVDLERG
jgi:hypothetical protein